MKVHVQSATRDELLPYSKVLFGTAKSKIFFGKVGYDNF